MDFSSDKTTDSQFFVSMRRDQSVTLIFTQSALAKGTVD
jgi:hypothetical protein